MVILFINPINVQSAIKLSLQFIKMNKNIIYLNLFKNIFSNNKPYSNKT